VLNTARATTSQRQLEPASQRPRKREPSQSADPSNTPPTPPGSSLPLILNPDQPLLSQVLNAARSTTSQRRLEPASQRSRKRERVCKLEGTGHVDHSDGEGGGSDGDESEHEDFDVRALLLDPNETLTPALGRWQSGSKRALHVTLTMQPPERGSWNFDVRRHRVDPQVPSFSLHRITVPFAPIPCPSPLAPTPLYRIPLCPSDVCPPYATGRRRPLPG
jgi:hypothetical protein